MNAPKGTKKKSKAKTIGWIVGGLCVVFLLPAPVRPAVILLTLSVFLFVLAIKKSKQKKETLKNAQNNQASAIGSHSNSERLTANNTDLTMSRQKDNDDDASMPSFVIKGSVMYATNRHSIPAGDQKAADAKWYGAGQVVEVAGRIIRGGLVYVGTRVAHDEWGRGEPSLINPLKPVVEKGDYTYTQLSYYPSYEEANKIDRASYLDWLASGRRDPSALITYVFIFFYGLERRVVVDSEHDVVAKGDWSSIRKEVEALLEVYGEKSRSFQGYANGLLLFMDLKESDVNKTDFDLSKIERSNETPIQLKLALARSVTAGKPIAPELAYEWSRHIPTLFLNERLRRCAHEYERMFKHLYLSTNKGAGLLIKPNKTTIQHSYRNASPVLYSQSRGIRFGDLPDVTVLSGVVKKIEAVGNQAMAAIDTYSRYVARYKEKNSFAAKMLLPREIWENDEIQFVAKLNSAVSQRHVVHKVTDFVSEFGLLELPSRNQFEYISGALQNEGFGIEPDVPNGAKLPKEVDSVVIFAANTKSFTPTVSYSVAQFIVNLSAAVASADGSLDSNEKTHLETMINSWTYLSAVERNRLNAVLELALIAPVSLSTLKKKVEQVDMPTREMIAAQMAVVAQSDGVVTADEIKMLEKIYKLLGVDGDKVFRDVHAADTDVALTSLSKEKENKGFRLDPKRISELQKDTVATSQILTSIFSDGGDAHTVDIEPEAEKLADDTSSTAPAYSIMGLNQQHTDFARLLLTRSEWSRTELLDAATDLEVMLDGALEAINEAAFAEHDMPFIEGDDEFVVNPDIYQKVVV